MTCISICTPDISILHTKLHTTGLFQERMRQALPAPQRPTRRRLGAHFVHFSAFVRHRASKSSPHRRLFAPSLPPSYRSSVVMVAAKPTPPLSRLFSYHRLPTFNLQLPSFSSCYVRPARPLRPRRSLALSLGLRGTRGGVGFGRRWGWEAESLCRLRLRSGGDYCDTARKSTIS